MIFLCYPKCSTCGKAQKYLDDRNIKYEFRNIKENPPTYEEIKKWYKLSGLNLKKFFNTSGLSYKALNLKEKFSNLSEEECFKLLSSDGMLVKRPMLISEDKIFVGFKEKEWENILK